MTPRTCSNGHSEFPNCFSAKSKRRAKAVVALSFAALCAVGLSGGGARAGFLEDLFGAFSGRAEGRSAFARIRVFRAAGSSTPGVEPVLIQKQRRKAAHPPSDGMATAGPEASGLCYAAPARRAPDLISRTSFCTTQRCARATA